MSISRFYFIFSFTLVCLFPTISFSQKGDNRNERHTDSIKIREIDADKVVVTAQYTPQSANRSLYKVNTINLKDIELSGSQNLRDVLQTSLNIRLSQDNILGSSLSLQGLSGENVKILIDGVPMIGRQDGNIDLSQINLNNIEQIEIIEGPLSVNYGSNALAGVINLITKKEQQYKFQTTVSSYHETIGNYNLSIKTGYKIKKSQLSLMLGRNYFDGWNSNEKYTLFPKETLADDNRHKQWKPKEQYFSEFQFIHQLKKNRFIYRFSFFDEKITNLGLPRNPYKETAFDDYYFTKRLDQSLNINGNISQNLQYHFLVAHNHYNRIKNTYLKNLTNLQQSISQNSSDQDTSGFQLINSRGTVTNTNGAKYINYEIGYDISVEYAQGKRIRSKQQDIGDYAFFSSIEYKPISSLILRPGIRYAFNTNYKSPLTPSVNIKYTLNHKLSLRASYAKGFRSPSLKELFFYFVDVNHNIIGNPDLLPEKSNHYSIILTYLNAKEKHIIKIEPSIFYNNVYNMITLAQSNNIEYTYMNIDNFSSKGVQLNNVIALQQWKFDLGIAYTGRYNKISENNINTKQFSYYPEFKSNIRYEFLKRSITIALFYKYTGAIPSYSLSSENKIQEQKTDDYHITDITLTKSFVNKKIQLGLGCKNIFDVQNIKSFGTGTAHTEASTSSPIAMGRSYFIKLNITLAK